MIGEAALDHPGAVGEIWSALHKDADLLIGEAETHYLTLVALSLEEDLLSWLLLRKLRLARTVPDAEIPPGRIRMNSVLEYAFDGQRRRLCQIVHADAHQPGQGLGIASREGTGLIGMAAGQSILWPSRWGGLRELEVLRVLAPADDGDGRRPRGMARTCGLVR